MPQSFVCLYCHLVFSTKNRLPLIGDDIRGRLHEYIGGILRNNGCDPIAIGGTMDHVHTIFRLGKQIAPCEVVRLAKAGSSRWVHETFPELRDFGWQSGYGMFPVSAQGLEGAKAYVVNQAENHRERPFQEEYLDFLRRHGVSYGERYVWD
ncbi:MAG: IS200/IS605 family transposase [Bacteroidota bacterium]